MHVAGLEADPVHGRQVPDRVRRVGVLDEFGPGGGARGEVEHQRVVGPGRGVGREVGGGAVRLLQRQPALRGRTGRDARVGAGDLGELSGVLRARDDMPDPAAVDAVAQVGRAEQRGGRDDDRAQFHRRERGDPQFGLVAEHDEDPVLGAHAPGAQPVGELCRAHGHLPEGQPGLAAVLLDDVQGGAGVAVRDLVEPVERPVEVLGTGPAEAVVGRGVVLAVFQQEVPRPAEHLRRRCHLSSWVPDHCRAAHNHRVIRDAGLTTPERGVRPHRSRSEGANR